MLNQEEVISVYEKVSDITEQMLAAARSGDWERLSMLEGDCADQVDILRTGESSVPLSGSWREAKVRIIRKILEDDRQIRLLVEPWMAQLAALIRSTGTERKLSQAYGAAG